ncbi:hypothetical protein C7W88_17935 (plasmid) [Novosphingobium sp. THN1]|nr:hypothetical protein C7W88_17935 [Novosphingobium sp. THN1]
MASGRWCLLEGKERTNPIEAQAIVDEAVRLLRDPSFVDAGGEPLSLGIITMNIHQMKLVEDLLDKARQRYPAMERFFNSDAMLEPVCVRNLETAQGDERDVILLGVGFGPTEPGGRTMSMNFGKLNPNGGWRRLNVAVTRARREMHVFTSFDPGMIDLTRTSADGVRDLKTFIEFANRGKDSLASADRGSLGGTIHPSRKPLPTSCAAAVGSSCPKSAFQSSASISAWFTPIGQEISCAASNATVRRTTVQLPRVTATASGPPFWRAWAGSWSGSGRPNGGSIANGLPKSCIESWSRFSLPIACAVKRLRPLLPPQRFRPPVSPRVNSPMSKSQSSMAPRHPTMMTPSLRVKLKSQMTKRVMFRLRHWWKPTLPACQPTRASTSVPTCRVLPVRSMPINSTR